MPLVKSTSKQAFETNIRREIKAGKPPKQAVAIAYSVKREAAGGRGHYSREIAKSLMKHRKKRKHK